MSDYKEFTYLQLMNIVDGRLFTSMDDIYDILDHIFSTNNTTIGLTITYDKLKKVNPKWFSELVDNYNNQIVKYGLNKSDFEEMRLFVTHKNTVINVPCMRISNPEL